MQDRVRTYIEEHESDFLAELEALLRIPSVSTDSRHSADVRRAAEKVHGLFEAAGVPARIIETSRHPAVLADTGPEEAADGPVVLVYGHFDVQPAGDPDLWDSPAFEPTHREGRIYARGSADDKGQVLCHVMAATAWMKAAGATPCRVKYLIEGEEEIGSPNLVPLVREHEADLACDVVMISDTAKLSHEQPAITCGTKGLVYKDVKVYGPKQDLHSGAFGGTVANPGNVLASILAGLRDARGRVTIPGFYDAVRDPTADEREQFASLPFDEEAYREALGAPALDGEPGWSTLERRWVRPTLDVNGLYGGYGGEGAMTIVPAMCGAKVSMRLVPDQDPDEIARIFDERVRELCPDTVRLEIDSHSVAWPYLTPPDLPALRAAREAVAEVWGREPALIREGGSIPIMHLFREELGAESVLMGFADPNCNLHGPNEFFHRDDYLRGIRAAAAFLERVAS